MRLLASHFPVLILTGARQTGKTSLLRRLYPELPLVSLDLPSLAEEAERRPLDLLRRFPPPVVLDEVQYAPSLLRHLKVSVDSDRAKTGQFLMTGSQKLPLMKAVSESLAGRCAILDLRSLSAAEYKEGGQWTPEDGLEFIVRGGFPEVCARPSLPAVDFFRAYVATYLERDLRNLIHVGSLRDFERFIRVAASRSGCLLNMAEIARDVGISASTTRQWLSVLEASGIVILLEPYFANFGKRVAKSPKLYFTDTGLLCFLLGISSRAILEESPMQGQIWETFILGQILREVERRGSASTVWFWRDASNLEVDFFIDSGSRVELIECKWTEAPAPRDLLSLNKLLALIGPSRLARGRIACRTPHAYAVSDTVVAVNGFEERDWIQ